MPPSQAVRPSVAGCAALKLISTGKRALNAKGSNLALEAHQPLMQFQPLSLPSLPKSHPNSADRTTNRAIYRPCQLCPAGKEEEEEDKTGGAGGRAFERQGAAHSLVRPLARLLTRCKQRGRPL